MKKVHIITQTYVLYDSFMHRKYARDKSKIIGNVFVFHVILANFCYVKEVDKWNRT